LKSRKNCIVREEIEQAFFVRKADLFLVYRILFYLSIFLRLDPRASAHYVDEEGAEEVTKESMVPASAQALVLNTDVERGVVLED
jgi:hypothetical protein